MINHFLNATTLLATLELASYAHRHQKRSARHKKDKLPYIHHPIQVAHGIARAAADESAQELLSRQGTDWVGPTLLAAIVHDVMEDTDTPRSEIEAIAGREAAGIAAEVTDPDDMPKDTAQRKAKQAEKATTYSLGATNLKISDQTRNLRDVLNLKPSWSVEKIIAYANGAKQIVEATHGAFRLPLLEREFDDAYAALVANAADIGV